jgi:hypothetical protein
LLGRGILLGWIQQHGLLGLFYQLQSLTLELVMFRLLPEIKL